MAISKKNLKIWQLWRIIFHVKVRAFQSSPFFNSLLLQDWPSLPFCGWHILQESPCGRK
jgi:hypothetical protein